MTGVPTATAQVPAVVESEGTHAAFPYIEGIRIFNLLVELDRLEPPLDSAGRRLKRLLLARCEARQKEIQRALLSYPGSGRNPYPIAEKIRSIIEILSDPLGIIVDFSRLQAELEAVAEWWRPLATVPFRDATTKNMVLAEPSLWLGRFDSEDARRQYLIRTLGQDDPPEWLDQPIVDFDFSSCVELSTPEDDPISLRYHERTWIGPPVGPESVVWNHAADGRRAALTFFVRYYRFGGRKAAYRLLHPSGHRIRFRHDNDRFYFERLPSIVLRLWKRSESEIPELLACTRAIGRSLGGGRPEVDSFMAAGLGEKRTYYVDMYPE